MTYPPYIREKALELRHRGMTLDEIAERLALPKTTVYSWIKDVEIPRTKRQIAAQIRASMTIVATAKAKRDAAYAQGRAEYRQLAAQPASCACTSGRAPTEPQHGRHLQLRPDGDGPGAPLDPAPDVTVDVLQPSVPRRSGRRRAAAALDGGLEIRPEQIRLQRKSNGNQLAGRAWRSQWGVLTVGSSDTYLRARLQAWIDLTKDRWLDSIVIGV